MSLTVKNTQRVDFVLNLRHETKVEDDSPYGPTKFEMESAVEPRLGQEPGVRLIEKTLPGSISWLPDETLTGLPDGLLELEEFKRARAKRWLVVVEGGDVRAKEKATRVAGEPKRYDGAKPRSGATETSNKGGEKA